MKFGRKHAWNGSAKSSAFRPSMSAMESYIKVSCNYSIKMHCDMGRVYKIEVPLATAIACVSRNANILPALCPPLYSCYRPEDPFLDKILKAFFSLNI